MSSDAVEPPVRFRPRRCECGQYPDICARYGHAGGYEPGEAIEPPSDSHGGVARGAGWTVSGFGPGKAPPADEPPFICGETWRAPRVDAPTSVDVNHVCILPIGGHPPSVLIQHRCSCGATHDALTPHPDAGMAR